MANLLERTQHNGGSSMKDKKAEEGWATKRPAQHFKEEEEDDHARNVVVGRHQKN